MFGINNNTDPVTGAQQPQPVAVPTDAAGMSPSPGIIGPGAAEPSTSMPTAAEVAAQLSSSPVVTAPVPVSTSPLAGSSSLEDSSTAVSSSSGGTPDASSSDNLSSSDPSASYSTVPDPMSGYTNYNSSAPTVPDTNPSPSASNFDSSSIDGSDPEPSKPADDNSSSSSDGSASDQGDSSGYNPVTNFHTDSDDKSSDSDSTAPNVSPADNEELLDIKQDVLSSLAPLVDHLEQTPEEKFRTTMMMIQASDNSSLVRAAYEAAQGITDEKAKAQALLDVVNEINYFTHQSGNTTPPATT